jgi:hypothetical protein
LKSYALASASGLTFAAYFFLSLSGAIAAAIYVLLTRVSARRAHFATWTVRKAVAAPLALLICVLLFATIYFSSLAGFHTLSVGEAGILMDYAVPRRRVALGYDEIGDVMRRPAFRMQWRLEIYTLAGLRFESAPGSYRSVREAAQEIQRRLQR